MQTARFPAAFLLPVLVAAASFPCGVAEGQTLLPASQELPPVRVELYGPGAGTMVLPDVTDGHARALLHDETSAATFELEAALVPYHFLLEHAPAGALHGGIYTQVDPESTDEPALVARVEGEWGIDEDGVGVVSALLLIDDGPSGAARVAGAIRGSFRVLVTEPPVQIAPPLYLPPPVEVPSGSVHVTHASVARELAPVRVRRGAPPPAATTASGTAPEPVAPAASAEAALAPPAVVVDSIDSPLVARLRLRWWLAL